MTQFTYGNHFYEQMELIVKNNYDLDIMLSFNPVASANGVNTYNLIPTVSALPSGENFLPNPALWDYGVPNNNVPNKPVILGPFPNWVTTIHPGGNGSLVWNHNPVNQVNSPEPNYFILLGILIFTIALLKKRIRRTRGKFES